MRLAAAGTRDERSPLAIADASVVTHATGDHTELTAAADLEPVEVEHHAASVAAVRDRSM